MSEKLTREQIEEWRDELADEYQSNRLAVKQLTALCDLALSAAEAEQRGRAAGLAEAAKHADKRSIQVWDGCENVEPMDPETGATECSLERRGGSCLCQERFEALENIAREIRALSPSPDHVLVPREPTEAMVNAGTDARWASAVRDANNVREIYRAMIAEVK